MTCCHFIWYVLELFSNSISLLIVVIGLFVGFLLPHLRNIVIIFILTWISNDLFFNQSKWHFLLLLLGLFLSTFIYPFMWPLILLPEWWSIIFNHRWLSLSNRKILLQSLIIVESHCSCCLICYRILRWNLVLVYRLKLLKWIVSNYL